MERQHGSIRFLIGPAGTGKTWKCLTEVRAALAEDPEGLPLVFLAPKQATFQLERDLLAGGTPAGYTRLQILSFDRLASFVLRETGPQMPSLLSEEGRIMVLRALLARHQGHLRLFRASARLPGFAEELSRLFREFHEHGIPPATLATVAEKLAPDDPLARKLTDLARILTEYREWLDRNQLEDGDQLLEFASKAIHDVSDRIRFGGLWMDGFAEMTPQELEFLTAILPLCDRVTLAFCLDHNSPASPSSWLSTWSLVSRTYERCRERIAALDYPTTVERLHRVPEHGRFAGNPVLDRLEASWPGSAPASGILAGAPESTPTNSIVRIIRCRNPEHEAEAAAREIVEHTRARGGRYRDVAVLTRTLDPYHSVLQRVFRRFDIPYFLDRRQPVAHHPLAELTRHALRVVGSNYRHDDWFAALKTGLVPIDDEAVDRLENEALARGWHGGVWQKPIQVRDEPDLQSWVESIREKVLPPFQTLASRIQTPVEPPGGTDLAAALRDFWRDLRVQDRLSAWERNNTVESAHDAVHATVWEQMQAWLDNLDLAFADERLPLRDWIPIVESGLARLTVGVIPPALDQVLIGAIDRSRNPDLKLSILLGLNESVFPLKPDDGGLLTDLERKSLEEHRLFVGTSKQMQLGRERYFEYIALSRSRERLIATFSEQGSGGQTLNPSPFIDRIIACLPWVTVEFPADGSPQSALHPCQLPPAWRLALRTATSTSPALSTADGFDLAEWSRLQDDHLSPTLAAALYGSDLRTSVSRIEDFAACPFRFFVRSGLRAEERRRFALDHRQRGRFQHEILQRFHESLTAEGRSWRQCTPDEAEARIATIGTGFMSDFGDGLLIRDDRHRFFARQMTDSLRSFIRAQIEWMKQYDFNPAAVETPFGEEEQGLPAWTIELENGRRIRFRGVIDRVDLLPLDGRDEAWCIVIDYKSSARTLDNVLMHHGIQLQLPAYLGVLKNLSDPDRFFGVRRLVPVGGFYVNLRPSQSSAPNRIAARNAASSQKSPHQHRGRFNREVLGRLDNRPDCPQGDQFSYRRNADGALRANTVDALSPGEFAAMLARVEALLAAMGNEIYNGNVRVDPFRHGSHRACDHCDFPSVCRIDPWTHRWRQLARPEPSAPAPTENPDSTLQSDSPPDGART